MRLKMASVALLAAITGCATTSGVMEAENGVYLISGRAAPAAGGAAGAQQVAYKEAQAFCGTKGRRAVVLDARDRDVYQGAAASSWSANSGSAGGGFAAGGQANLAFRCVE